MRLVQAAGSRTLAQMEKPRDLEVARLVLGGEKLLGLRLRLAGGWRLIAAARVGSAMSSSFFLHGIELLLLLIVEDGFDFRFRVFANRLHLGAAIFAGERLILPERLHLLLAIREDGPDLVLLIGRQIELPSHVLQLAIRVHAATAVFHAAGLFLLRRRSAIVLGQERAGAENQHAAKSD